MGSEEVENVCTFFSGGTPTSTNREYYKGSIPFIGSGDISDKSVTKHITTEAFNNSSAKMVEVGDLLYALYGATSGQIGISKINGAINQAVLCIKTIEHKEFLYQILKFSKDKIISTYLQGGQGNLSAQIIKNLKLPFPTLPEQQKIAHFFSIVDKKLSQLQEKKTALELYKKGMMQQIFSQQLRFKDDNGNDFPDWEVKKLGDYIEVISGYAFKGDDITENENGIPLLRGINITEGYIRHSKQIDRFYNGNLEKLEKYFLKENDLVIGMDGSKVGKNISLVTKKDVNSLLIQRVARLRSNSKSNINFVFQIIFSNWFIRYVDIVNTSSGIPHISLKQINDFSFNFPSLKEQNKIANFLSKIDQIITNCELQITNTKEYKKGLLQRMFV